MPAWEPAAATTPDPDYADRLDRARVLLRGRRIVALTGAGISTDSGIPDYRSPGAPNGSATNRSAVSSGRLR